MILGGMRVFTNPYMTKDGPPTEVRRTLGERLCRFKPWRPFKLTKTIIPQIPSDVIYKIRPDIMGTSLLPPNKNWKSNEWVLVMHPEMFKQVAEEMDRVYRANDFQDAVMMNKFIH